MAAAVSGFLGFAIAKVVDQFWTPTTEEETTTTTITTTITAETESIIKPEATTPIKASPVKATPRANARRNNRRKASTKTVEIELPMDVKTRSYSDADPVELSSNASTCGSSDDEDEDIGAKEMRLMLERAQQIKRLTKQSRQQRPKETRAKGTKTKEVAETTPSRFPDVRAHVRLQNKTTTLWSWSVYSGFAVDTKIANRGPRNMRHLYCNFGEVEALESEQLLLDLAADVLADN